MNYFHRNLRLMIAVVFTVEGMLLGYTVSTSLREINLFTVFLSAISLLVLAGSMYVVSRVNLSEDVIEGYEITEDGYISIVSLMDGEDEDDESLALETFEESVADVAVPVVEKVQVVPIDHPVFDVDTSEPLYDDTTPTHAMVLVGHLATETVAIEEDSSTRPKALEIPAKPVKKPFVLEPSPSFALDMSTFLKTPLTDPEFMLALQDIHNKMSPSDVMIATGKSYGLGARGKRIPNTNQTEYTKADVKKMILKFLSKPSAPVTTSEQKDEK